LALSPEALKLSLQGLLAFALTPFDASGDIDTRTLRNEVEMLLTTKCAAVFTAGGLGEFFSLAPAEYKSVVETCVDQVRGRIPVVAGAGYGTRLAREFVQVAEEAGADGVLLLPPYLVSAPQHGLAEHYLAVASASRIGVIIYQRDAAVFEPRTVEMIARIENVIGFKDGVGDVDRLQRTSKVVGDRLVFMNGMPTAEVYARSLAACGVRTYSSALLAFMPEISVAFGMAFETGDQATMDDLLNRAIIPFADIRRRVPGYAVSLVKAGARLRGIPVGQVRPPLADPSRADEEDLRRLLEELELDHRLAYK
jgi:5-dehydro-4-deoxyglucarate dehydratase